MAKNNQFQVVLNLESIAMLTGFVPNLSSNNEYRIVAASEWIAEHGGGGGGNINSITSTDKSVSITNPEGPIVDLSVSGSSAGVSDINTLTGSVKIDAKIYDPDTNPIGVDTVKADEGNEIWLGFTASKMLDNKTLKVNNETKAIEVTARAQDIVSDGNVLEADDTLDSLPLVLQDNKTSANNRFLAIIDEKAIALRIYGKVTFESEDIAKDVLMSLSLATNDLSTSVVVAEAPIEGSGTFDVDFDTEITDIEGFLGQWAYIVETGTVPFTATINEITLEIQYLDKNSNVQIDLLNLQNKVKGPNLRLEEFSIQNIDYTVKVNGLSVGASSSVKIPVTYNFACIDEILWEINGPDSKVTEDDGVEIGDYSTNITISIDLTATFDTAIEQGFNLGRFRWDLLDKDGVRINTICNVVDAFWEIDGTITASANVTLSALQASLTKKVQMSYNWNGRASNMNLEQLSTYLLSGRGNK